MIFLLDLPSARSQTLRLDRVFLFVLNPRIPNLNTEIERTQSVDRAEGILSLRQVRSNGMFSLLLSVLGDALAAAEADRQRRALAARLGWTPETMTREASAYEGNSEPYTLTADTLDWRFEPAYPVRRLLDYAWEGSRRDAHQLLADDTAERGLAWFRSFARWYRREPESQPIVLVEDVHGDLEGIWDGWHRSALAVEAGMTGVPAIVGQRRWDRSVAGRQALAVKTYGVTDNPGCVAFILSDGSWIDFSEGSDLRAQDHRAITWLVPEDEQAALQIRGEPERTLVMNHWMNVAQAIRVSLGSSGYALVDLPDEAEATVAVLRDPRGLGRWVRFADDFDLNWRGQVWSNLDRRALGTELRGIREKALSEIASRRTS